MKFAVPEPDTAADVAIRVAGSEDADRWDAFVNATPEATFFHRFGWRRVISEAFGHRPYYLIAERAGSVCGVLPLFHLRSLLFGNSLISVPFCVYGGVVAADSETVRQLTGEAMHLARELKVDCLELRNLEPQNPGWPTKDLYVTFRREIAADDDANLAAIPRKQRAMVRRGIKAGLQSRVDNEVDTVYSMYAESVRNLGTPVFSRRYFRLLKEEFGEDCELLVISSADEPVSGVLSFYFRDEVLPYYGGGTAAARTVSANDYMYWQVMSRAAARGVRVFDYGRSKQGTGSYRFKKHWGFEPRPLYYEFGLVRADKMPDLSPANPKYRLFISLWKRLPVSLSRLVGPVLSRNLG